MTERSILKHAPAAPDTPPLISIGATMAAACSGSSRSYSFTTSPGTPSALLGAVTPRPGAFGNTYEYEEVAYTG